MPTSTPMPVDKRAFVEAVFEEFADVPTAVVHGDPGASNIRMTSTGRVGLLDWDESRVDVTWHDLSNLGVAILGARQHERALTLSDAWEAANAWTAEPDHRLERCAILGGDLRRAPSPRTVDVSGGMAH